MAKRPLKKAFDFLQFSSRAPKFSFRNTEPMSVWNKDLVSARSRNPVEQPHTGTTTLLSGFNLLEQESSYGLKELRELKELKELRNSGN